MGHPTAMTVGSQFDICATIVGEALFESTPTPLKRWATLTFENAAHKGRRYMAQRNS